MRCRRGSREELKLPVFHPGIVMEGGAVDFNGAGTVLTTTSCLLNKNRNPRTCRSKRDREISCATTTGRSTSCGWVKASKATTPTVTSTISRASSTSARSRSAIETNKRDPNYAILQKARRALDRARDQDGLPFDIVELPMPRPIAYEGQRVPATYVNFYFANRALLVPTFGQRDRDRRAHRDSAKAPA